MNKMNEQKREVASRATLEYKRDDAVVEIIFNYEGTVKPTIYRTFEDLLIANGYSFVTMRDETTAWKVDKSMYAEVKASEPGLKGDE